MILFKLRMKGKQAQINTYNHDIDTVDILRNRRSLSHRHERREDKMLWRSWCWARGIAVTAKYGGRAWFRTVVNIWFHGLKYSCFCLLPTLFHSFYEFITYVTKYIFMYFSMMWSTPCILFHILLLREVGENQHLVSFALSWVFASLFK